MKLPPRIKGEPIKFRKDVFTIAPFDQWTLNFRLTENIDDTDIKKFIVLIGALKNLAAHLRLPRRHIDATTDLVGEVSRSGRSIKAEELSTGGRKFLIYIDPSSEYYELTKELVFKILPGYYRENDRPTFRFALKGSGGRKTVLSETELARVVQIEGITAAVPMEQTIDQMLHELYSDYLPSRIELTEIPIISLNLGGKEINLVNQDKRFPLATGPNQAHQMLFLELEGTDLREFIDLLEEKKANEALSKIFELRYHPDYRDLIDKFANNEISLEDFLNKFLDIFIGRFVMNIRHFKRIKLDWRHSQNTSLAGGLQDFEECGILPADVIRTEGLYIEEQIGFIKGMIYAYKNCFNINYRPSSSKALLNYYTFFSKFNFYDHNLKGVHQEDIDAEFVSLLIDLSIAGHSFQKNIPGALIYSAHPEIKKDTIARLVNLLKTCTFRSLTKAERNCFIAPDIQILVVLFRYSKALGFNRDVDSINEVINYFLINLVAISRDDAISILETLNKNLIDDITLYPELHRLKFSLNIRTGAYPGIKREG